MQRSAPTVLSVRSYEVDLEKIFLKFQYEKIKSMLLILDRKKWGFQCSKSLILNRKHTKVNYELRQVTDSFREKNGGGDFVESLAHS